MANEDINNAGLSENKHTERKDDRSHNTSGGRTSDPGRTPGTAEGDRANVEKKYDEQRESVERTKNTRDQSHS